MKNEPGKITSIEHVTHDVIRIVLEKPEGADFVSGQATEIFIDKEGWQNEGRPFTLTCLPTDDYLEFTIKTYLSHNGVTNELLNLKPGDTLIVNDVFGAIEYKGEGTFIAGGAGVTPFISILRNLKAQHKLANNKLIFSNKTEKDIILRNEFQDMLAENFINILSQEKTDRYPNGHISEEFIKNNATSLGSYFYVCGPPPMMDEVLKQLSNLNVSQERIVTEEF